MKLVMEGWRQFLTEVDREEALAAEKARRQGIRDEKRAAHDAKMAQLKDAAGKSPLEILQAQDDGSPEMAQIKKILGATEQEKKKALDTLAVQQKSVSDLNAELTKKAAQQTQKHTAQMDKMRAMMQQFADQTKNPAAAQIAAAQQAEIEKLKQKNAEIVTNFKKQLGAAEDQGGAKKSPFDPATGEPQNERGEQLCAKNPECYEKWIKPVTASKFSTRTGQPSANLHALAQQNNEE